MIKNYISTIMSVCFYLALVFIGIGFIFIFINGSGAGVKISHISFLPIMNSFFSGNSAASFTIASFIICFAPFFSAIAIAIHSAIHKNITLLVIAGVLFTLFGFSLFFN